MKKLLLLLLLFPLVLSAKFRGGTISLKDGTIKVGMVNVPRHSQAKKIKFKKNEKADVEKIELKDVEGFTIVTEDKRVLRYITLKIANLKAFKTEYKVDDRISWVRLEHEDNISIVVAFFRMGNTVNPAYYLHKRGDDHCKFITVFYGGFVIPIGEFSNIKNVCEILFKDDCPLLHEKLSKEAYKEKSLLAITDLYNELCAGK